MTCSGVCAVCWLGLAGQGQARPLAQPGVVEGAVAGVCLAPEAALPGKRGTEGGRSGGRRAPEFKEAKGQRKKEKPYSPQYFQTVSKPKN